MPSSSTTFSIGGVFGKASKASGAAVDTLEAGAGTASTAEALVSATKDPVIPESAAGASDEIAGSTTSVTSVTSATSAEAAKAEESSSADAPALVAAESSSRRLFIFFDLALERLNFSSMRSRRILRLFSHSLSFSKRRIAYIRDARNMCWGHTITKKGDGLKPPPTC